MIFGDTGGRAGDCVFVFELESRQNSSTFVHMAEPQHYPHLEYIFMVRCGSKNHELFVAECLNRVERGRFARGIIAEYDSDSRGESSRD